MTENLTGFILACCFWANLSSALLGPYVAGQRNRSMAVGFLFGVLFGPLGLIIVACLPTVPAAASSVRITEKPPGSVNVEAAQAFAAAARAAGPPPVPVARQRAVVVEPPYPTADEREEAKVKEMLADLDRKAVPLRSRDGHAPAGGQAGPKTKGA